MKSLKFHSVPFRSPFSRLGCRLPADVYGEMPLLFTGPCLLSNISPGRQCEAAAERRSITVTLPRWVPVGDFYQFPRDASKGDSVYISNSTTGVEWQRAGFSSQSSII